MHIAWLTGRVAYYGMLQECSAIDSNFLLVRPYHGEHGGKSIYPGVHRFAMHVCYGSKWELACHS